MTDPNVPAYILGDRLGGGGQAQILAADHTELGLVALKVLKPEASEEALARLELEIRVLREIRARGAQSIVVALARTEDDMGRPVLVMERLVGETVSKRLRRAGPLRVDEAIAVARQVLAGLSVVHAVGVVHRDVKPGNVFLTQEGGVKLIDFGVAKVIEGTDNLTRTDVVVGSPRYVSPEQVTGGEVDRRADLYAIGLLLFEMISGAPPFGRQGSVDDALVAHAEHEAARLSKVAKVPAALDELVAAALSKDPAKRPQTAEDFARRLEQAVHPDRRLWLALGGVAVVTVLGVASTIGSRHRSPDATPPTAIAEARAEVPHGLPVVRSEPTTAPTASAPKNVAPRPTPRATGAAGVPSGRVSSAVPSVTASSSVKKEEPPVPSTSGPLPRTPAFML